MRYNYMNAIKKTIHSDGVFSLELLKNRNLVSGSFDTIIKIWNPNNCLLINTFVWHKCTDGQLKLLSNDNIATS